MEQFHNNIVHTIDERKEVFFVLFDLSAAFDTVDHDILLWFMKDYTGVDGPVLQFYQSYLSGKTSMCVNSLLAT